MTFSIPIPDNYHKQWIRFPEPLLLSFFDTLDDAINEFEKKGWYFDSIDPFTPRIVYFINYISQEHDVGLRILIENTI